MGFNELIQDDTKLEILEGVFDAINNEESTCLVSDEHYLKVEEARTEYLSGISSASSWEEVEDCLNIRFS